MPFTADAITIAGLMEIELVSGVLRLCDGGVLDWPGRGTFLGIDPTFGTIGGFETPTEAIGDAGAVGQVTISVPTPEAAVELAVPEMQGKALRFWLAEVDADSGLLLGTPTKLFEGLVDTVEITLSQNDRNVTIEFVDAGERLFAVREGNVLTTRFHQTAWPGELGFDHCTGAGIQVPWGVSGARGTGVFGSGGGGAERGINNNLRLV